MSKKRHDALIYTNFSSDGSRLCTSTEENFQIYLVDEVVSLLSSSSMFGGARCMQSLHHSNLFAFVPSGDRPGTSPRKLKIWNDDSVLQEVSVKHTIEDCRWNKDLICLITENDIYVHDLKTLSLKCTLPHHPKSWRADLSIDRCSILCYATPELVGSISIFDCQEQRLLNRISAHRSDIAQIAITSSGDKIASASTMGTLVRVFSAPAGDLLFTFRIANLSVNIQSLRFCHHDPSYLLCGAANNLWSICYVGDRVSPDDINGKLLITGDEEDGFCRVEIDDRSLVSNPLAGSTLMPDDRSIQQDTSIWSMATAQYMLDATMKSVQQLRNFSQDFLSPGKLTTGKGGNAAIGGVRKLRVDDIKTPDWQCILNIDDSPTNAVLVVSKDEEEDAENDELGGVEDQANSSISALKLLVVTKRGLFRRYRVGLNPAAASTSTCITALQGANAEAVLTIEDEKMLQDEQQ
jgi:WD40 repeat protein